MRQHIPHYSARQVPHIPGPDSLHLEAFHDLAENGFYAVAPAAQPTTPLGRRVKASLLVGDEHLNASLAQMLCQLGLPVVTVCKAVAARLSDHLFNHRQVTQISGGHKDASDHPGPSHPDVKAEAVEGLLDRMVFAIVSLASIVAAFFGASELANRDGEAIDDGNALVTVRRADELLPKRLFQLPQIGCLSNESRAMNESQGGEEMGVVTTKVVEQSLVLAQPEIFADGFQGEDFAISKPRLRPTPAEPLLAEMVAESIVNEAKHSYNEGIQVQGERPPIVDLAISIENASPWPFNFDLKTCTSRYISR